MNLQGFCKFQKQLNLQVYKVKLDSDEKLPSLIRRLHKTSCELVLPLSHLLATLHQTEGKLELLGSLNARFRAVF